MKYTDDYQAKFRIWAQERKIFSLPKMVLPFEIESQKFNSYKEMNEWKQQLLQRIAAAGGVKWGR